MDGLAVEVSDLRKTWRAMWGKKTVALDGLSLSVPRGVCFALLGPAGAGKTTLGKVLASLTRADSGFIRVLGAPPGRAGVCLLTASPSRPMLERLQQTALGPAPGLLICDHPQDALDPAGREETLRCLRSLADRGATILINSRHPADIEPLCTQAAFLRAGKVIAVGTVEQLLGSRRFRVIVTALPDCLQDELAASGFIIGMNEGSCWIESIERRRLNPLIDRIRAAGGSIESVESIPASLERLLAEASGLSFPDQ
jgi:ABC-2 type transport system ATP-binding protein